MHVYALAFNDGSGRANYKISMTGRTLETRLREWRRKHESKSFTLVYSVQINSRSLKPTIKSSSTQ
ncbi:hypothetical protein D9758_018874 [Tetrapyrgos nigripes]|uniref:GIY-YIG nuclease family protein n=1 Tax=Tetrapyrgos nigripes TaxID=182062 RepID=A0A8H5F9Q2_9AGAR|nr:hypothetical protein D9758_018874 [Tetrapyrgos nigripes]